MRHAPVTKSLPWGSISLGKKVGVGEEHPHNREKARTWAISCVGDIACFFLL